MAIKGKSRRRHAARGTGAPAPRPHASAGPLLSRPALRRALVVALSVGTVLGGARVWVNAERSEDLRAYLDAFGRAHSPMSQHLELDGEESLGPAVRAFTRAEIDPAPFRALADRWEADFRRAKELVAALRPPEPLRDAQDTILEGIDMFVGVARLLNLAAQQRQVADAQGGTAQRALEDKVQVTIIQANEWRERAENVYALGAARIEQVRREWLGIPAAEPVPGVPPGILSSSPAPVQT